MEPREPGVRFTDEGWLNCDGSDVSRTLYNRLYALIGTTYGAGDGTTTFTLPDARGRTIIGEGTGDTLTPRSNGDDGGAETISTVPKHTHLMVADYNTDVEAKITATDSLSMQSHEVDSVYKLRGVAPATALPTLGVTGETGDTTVNVMNPFLVANVYIKT